MGGRTSRATLDACAPCPDSTGELFRAAFETNPVGMALARRTAEGRHRITAANNAFRSMHGGGTVEVSERFLEELLDGPETEQTYRDGWRERRCRDGDGRESWIRWNVTSLSTRTDSSTQFLIQIDVITDRVKARLQAQRQARLLDLIPEPVIIRGLDGTVLYWNSGAAQIYGIPAADALGRRTHDLLHTEFHGITLRELEQRLAADGAWRGQLEHRHADGRVLRMTSSHIRDEHGDGQPVILEINVDVTDRLAAEQALAASEAKFRSQFAHSTVGQMIRRMDGRIEEVNQAFADMLGYTPDELIGSSADRLFSPSVADVRRDAVAALVRGDVEAVNGEGTLTRADGSVLDVEINVSVARGADGAAERIVGIFQDITARKIAEHALTHQASHDALTGLANRSLLVERITQALAAARTSTRTVGLLYLDLDGFKAVNDTHGHHTGDALLVEVAQRLLQCVRGGDTVARLGGDEFVVLCPDLDTPARLHAVAERVLTKLGAPYELAGRRVDTVTASVGITYPTPTTDPTEALRDADQAMYEVKRSGKNRIGLHVTGVPAQRVRCRTA